MKIFNVIEIKNNEVVKLESFAVYEPQLSSDVLEDAKEHLIKLINFRHEAIDFDEISLDNLPITLSGYTWDIYATHV